MSESPAPYTLSEFDTAINAQLLHLFLTELPSPLWRDGAPVDPPPTVPGQPVSEKEYLISHMLHMKPTSKGQYGLYGYIECPRVDFDGINLAADGKCTVKAIFKFIDNKLSTQANAEHRSIALVWDYKELDVDGRPRFKPFSLSSYSIAFEASVGRADVQEVIEKRT